MQPYSWSAIAVTVAAVLAVAAVPTVWVRLASARHRFGAASVPHRPVAIVLGAAVWSTGPSPLLERRLRLAARLWHAGRAPAILVSGDDRPESGCETTTMVGFLVGLGLPEEVVMADRHGYRTWDTCVRAHDIFGVDRAIVVTQTFHLPRTVALCRAAGIDTVGVGDPSLARRSRSTVYGYVREVAANAKAMRDAVRRSPPSHTAR